MIRSYILILIIILSSCKDKNIPSDILPPHKMQTVLWDVIKADVFTIDYIAKDTSKVLAIENAKLQKQIFTFHKISKSQFDKSYEFYKKNPDLMIPILDSISNKATRKKNVNRINKPIFEKRYDE